MRKTPLEKWIASKVPDGKETRLTLNALRDYQLGKLQETIEYARARSPFYRRHLAEIGRDLPKSLEDLRRMPFTTSEDVVKESPRFLCVSQSRIERVVTLPVPGMPDRQKRIWLTSDDLALTVDFFHRGMETVTTPGSKVLILMPGDLPGSVGDLLVKALRRMNVEGIVHGIVKNPAAAIGDILRYKVDCLIGIPAQVLSIVRHPLAREISKGQIKSILLSADYVAGAIVREVRRVWDCPVFNHYGTTEMGLGGGVECDALAGYHLREGDLYVEIVEPDSGRSQTDGLPGEIVFTTLTRTGMPLIRYRTGDLAAWMPDPCPCGSILPRMGKVRGRIHEMVRLRSGDWLGITDIDEALFSLSPIVNYSATFIRQDPVDQLNIVVFPGSERDKVDRNSVEQALHKVPPIASGVSEGCLKLKPVKFTSENWVTTGVTKRSITQVEGLSDTCKGS